MAWPDDPLPAIRREAHFGDRVVRCFADRPVGVDQLLRRAVARNPGGDALVWADGRISYRGLDAAVGRTAAGLAALGVGRGDRVALLLGNRPEFVEAVLAVIRLGAVAVPLSVRLQRPELAYALADSGAVVLVHEAELAGRLPAPAEVSALRHRFAVGGDALGSEPFRALAADDPPPPVAVEEEDVAVILYTSGTTGRPKGAMLTHLNIVHSTLHYEVCFGLGVRDRALLAVPASHITGLIAIVFAMIHAAGAILLLPAFDVLAFLALAARERMTHTVLVPAMYRLCLLRADLAAYDLSSWRIGAFGGAPMDEATIAALARALPNLALANAYGATETTSPTTLTPPGRIAGHADSVGRVMPCAEVRVMDEAGCEVPPGATGELWITGPMVVRGYWNNPEATRASFTGGFWHSGDIGSIDALGWVRVFDRTKDVINRGGDKVFSAEVENILGQHPLVAEAAVVAKPCPVLGERVHAFVTRTRPGLEAAELRAFCAERLADYKVPESFDLGDAPLPRNANGKVIKRDLRERLRARLEGAREMA